MDRTVSGRILESESGRGIPGLAVRVYDKDLLHDDLLGAAVTNQEGSFSVRYSESDFQELFEKSPDVYVAVYAPPSRLLTDTSDTPIRDVGRDVHIELEVDRAVIGDPIPDPPDGVVTVDVRIDPEEVKVEKRGAFNRITMPGMAWGASPGAPALPETRHYVLLPLGSEVVSVAFDEGEPIIVDAAGLPLPVQAPVLDVGVAAEYGVDATIDNTPIRFTLPDPDIYEGVERHPRDLAQLLGSGTVGPVQVAVIRISPMRFDPASGRTLLYPDLRYEVGYERKAAHLTDDEPEAGGVRITEAQAELLQSITEGQSVFAAKDLFAAPVALVQAAVPHVIITDDYAWPEAVDRGDGTTRAPSLAERGPAVVGSLTAEFERLAEWKTARGVPSRVVTISEIVGGPPDFTEAGFARDLQEVVRNFVKHAHAAWDTQYVLLAGDPSVVPMRKLTGASGHGAIGCDREDRNPPAPARCAVRGTVAKLHMTFEPKPSDPLSTADGGVRIPFDREAGAGRLGWYYTTEGEFRKGNKGFTRLGRGSPTRFIIVEGPAAVVDDSYYWANDANSIPSDLYYASVVGRDYSRRGGHDFDTNNNGLYGQHHAPGGVWTSLDGVDLWSDVWVGRAPVVTQAEARGFVDKLITYESLKMPTGEAVDASYLEKVIYAAEWWFVRYVRRQSDTSTPPAAGTFTHIAGETTTKIRLDFDPSLPGGMPDRRLIAEDSTGKQEIPYDTDAHATSTGWYFTTDNTFATKSAEPTPFVKVVGPELDINPSEAFSWDPIALERAAAEKEQLRLLNDDWFPEFDAVERHYADYRDLAPTPPVWPLDPDTIRGSIDAGAHFVSLTGHGSFAGCCGIDVRKKPDFANIGKYFIAFADSCSTARPDGDKDSLGEVAVKDPDGGGVAYVGGSRMTWIGWTDDYERFFWRKLALTGRLGPAAGMRLADGNVRHTWTSYVLNLFGDPEMPVWTRKPETQQVDHPESVAWGGTLTVTVRKLDVPAAGHRVTLLGGWTNSSTPPRVYSSKVTRSDGTASFRLPSDRPAPPEVRLTVARANHRIYSAVIPVTSA